LGLYRRNNIWWYTLSHDGHRYQGSLKTANRRLAEKRYSRIVSQVVSNDFHCESGATIIETIERYLKEVSCLKSRSTYNRDCQIAEHYFRFFASDTLLTKVTSSLVSKYKAERLLKVSPSTVRKELSFLRRVFNLAIDEWELCNNNPVLKVIKSLPPETKRVRYLTPEEEERLRATLPAWLRPIVIVAMLTGLRRGNILELQVSQVDFRNNLIHVGTTKNGTPVSIPMTETVRETIRKTIDERKVDSPFVFTDDTGKPHTGWKVSMAFKRAAELAGISDLRFHDLRHDFATNLVRSGVDLYRVQKLLNHKDQRMTQRYAHLLLDDLRDAMERFEEAKSATILLQSGEGKGAAGD